MARSASTPTFTWGSLLPAVEPPIATCRPTDPTLFRLATDGPPRMVTFGVPAKFIFGFGGVDGIFLKPPVELRGRIETFAAPRSPGTATDDSLMSKSNMALAGEKFTSAVYLFFFLSSAFRCLHLRFDTGALSGSQDLRKVQSAQVHIQRLRVASKVMR